LSFFSTHPDEDAFEEIAWLSKIVFGTVIVVIEPASPGQIGNEEAAGAIEVIIVGDFLSLGFWPVELILRLFEVTMGL
jgi:hypothetical protein